MKTSWAGRLRCRIFLPDKSEVTFAKRGFTKTETARQENLEKVGAKFLEGFSFGMGGSSLPGIEESLERVDPVFRGFAYEGCAMALAVRDGIAPAGGHWVRDLLASRGSAHVYMVYVGAGWAMARLPRIRWRAVAPTDRLLRWLALDGYGFHQAYFRTSQYVTGQYQAPIPHWRSGYANRAVDQGIGRALWFVNGADVERLAAMIAGFAQDRRGDLWSGAGLASVYAGGADVSELTEMARLAGEYRTHVAQGAAFAGEARLRAGLVTPGTELGVKVHCGMSVEQAAALTQEIRQTLPESEGPDSGGPAPAYEVWRGLVRERFA